MKTSLLRIKDNFKRKGSHSHLGRVFLPYAPFDSGNQSPEAAGPTSYFDNYFCAISL